MPGHTELQEEGEISEKCGEYCWDRSQTQSGNGCPRWENVPVAVGVAPAVTLKQVSIYQIQAEDKMIGWEK